MTRFLSRLLFGEKKAPDIKQYELVKEIPCNDGFSIVVRGYDSTLETYSGEGREDLFIRRYPLLLKAPSQEAMEQFLAAHKGNREALQSDGTLFIHLLTGEMHIATQHAEIFSRQMKDVGIAVSEEAILEAVSEDMRKQGGRNFQPVEDPKKQARGR